MTTALNEDRQVAHPPAAVQTYPMLAGVLFLLSLVA